MKPGNRPVARCQFLQENILKDEEIQAYKPLLIREEALIFSIQSYICEGERRAIKWQGDYLLQNR